MTRDLSWVFSSRDLHALAANRVGQPAVARYMSWLVRSRDPDATTSNQEGQSAIDVRAMVVLMIQEEYF